MIGFHRLGRYGQLGNQMYQYAALLGVAQRRTFEPIIPPLRMHTLGATFAINARVGTAKDFASLRYVFQDERVGWWPDLDRIDDGTDLLGYFQSPRYFPPEAIVRREFTFLDQVAEPAHALEHKLRQRFDTLVGVTIRRGDYLNLTDKFTQVWDTDYYDRGIAHLAADGVGFVISSNDPQWTQARFDRSDVVVLDNTLADNSQLALLARCDHAVIANGSYGWWSAWLIDRPHKTVIAPAKWFEPNPEFTDDDRAPLPDGWLAF